MTSMFIQTEGTPNPSTLKFLPGCQVMPEGTANFTDAAGAARSPLAQRLFETQGVAGVLLGTDFITVGKAEEADWEIIKPLVLGAIMDHFVSEKPLFLDDRGDAPGSGADTNGLGEGPETDPVTSRIKELLDTRVRPAVAQDGGDIVFKSFENGVVTLHMQGACAGCPSSTATLKHGIENMLRHYIPEVLEVRAVE